LGAPKGGGETVESVAAEPVAEEVVTAEAPAEQPKEEKVDSGDIPF